MNEYKCKKCGKLLFKGDLESAVISIKCPLCNEVAEIKEDVCMVEGIRYWREFKDDSRFYYLTEKYSVESDKVDFAEFYAPRIYALKRRAYPDAKITFKLTEDGRCRYFSVSIRVDIWNGNSYSPYEEKLIGLYDDKSIKITYDMIRSE